MSNVDQPINIVSLPNNSPFEVTEACDNVSPNVSGIISVAFKPNQTMKRRQPLIIQNKCTQV